MSPCQLRQMMVYVRNTWQLGAVRYAPGFNEFFSVYDEDDALHCVGGITICFRQHGPIGIITCVYSVHMKGRDS